MLIHGHKESVILVEPFDIPFGFVLLGSGCIFIFIVREVEVVLICFVFDVFILIPVFNLQVVILVNVRTFGLILADNA